jgi:hypothetical protein
VVVNSWSIDGHVDEELACLEEWETGGQKEREREIERERRRESSEKMDIAL